MLRSDAAPANDEALKQELQQDIKKEREKKIGLDVAQRLLGLKNIDEEFDALKKRAWKSDFNFNEAKAAQPLRPYQEEAIVQLDKKLSAGAETVAVQLPTGAGKTFLVHSFLYDYALKKSSNIVVLTPSWEIANQHAATVVQQFKEGEKTLRRLGGRGHLISKFKEFSAGEKGKIIITTSALFYARREQLAEKLKASLIVIDEGHHGWRKKRLNSIQAYGREKGAQTILLTATPPANMAHLPFAVQLRYLDLSPEYLVPCEIVRLDTGEQFNPVVRNGILSQSSRVEISTRKSRIERIVAGSITKMRGQTIYYAGSVDEAIGVMEEFSNLGVTAVVVHSKWASKGDKINALAIDKFRSGRAQVLVNVQMLAMGFDVPNVETIIVARPVESDTLFTQMVGRGARPAEGKENFILIDVHDTISKPEVAKIFEHRHLFYSGAVDKLEDPMMPPPEEGRVIHLPLQPHPVIPEHVTESEFNRSRVVVGYFLKPYLKAA